jgi:hypothetical protein
VERWGSGVGMERQRPADDADELSWLLFRQEEVLSLGQALRHLSRKAIRHRVETGRWRQVHRAVFVTHNGPLSEPQLNWIAVLATGERAVLAGISAARAGGLRRYGDGKATHLLLPAGCRVTSPPAGVVVHRSTELPKSDLVEAGRPPRTRMARALVDAAQWARTDAEARAIIAAGFQQRLVKAGDIEDVIGRLGRLRRRRLIRQTAADAAGGAHALSELDFLTLVRRAGLPEPVCQPVRYDAAGNRRYLDFYFERWRVHVEIDGGQHLDPAAAWADMRRQNDLWLPGDRVLRFPAWAVRNTPQEVIAQLHTALTEAGWREELK